MCFRLTINESQSVIYVKALFTPLSMQTNIAFLTYIHRVSWHTLNLLYAAMPNVRLIPLNVGGIVPLSIKIPSSEGIYAWLCSGFNMLPLWLLILIHLLWMFTNSDQYYFFPQTLTPNADDN
ncbi:hypothetical protein T4B_909 [Trichinella pseudospiralis]|uniref:Uncharacterized protein n=2 Tax=Trichinella pseudospiralis TaxID=6337 RepID=A0A0V0YC51_TRIPS|nr:hypothetical protein T4E_260 [Trichinella pseudospiralis]KRY78493.1 hypothetical protein T4A_8335 [Trichinella pseudospiralis]KRY93473.1 hypothetical protein T4D_13905 [Trichinella pseudospiralis]KRZ28403.1 hypothetical protein T4B_909 [Trichinella pseudospiralis]KRZ43356.1 hypothetical protein T4C_7140 [Trichinella pseudospiralis]